MKRFQSALPPTAALFLLDPRICLIELLDGEGVVQRSGEAVLAWQNQ
jgi:hypothetical protein